MATAWIAGGSGLVGGALLGLLLREGPYDRVVSVGRRTLAREDPRLLQVVADLSDPAALERLDPPEVAYCCLGTTLARAGSREAFRRVDHGAVLAFARAARARGARVLVHVTALGADPRSRVFYNAVKGEAERDVAALGFPATWALRPSLLDGDRQERRVGERIALALARPLGPLLGRYRPTPVAAVARAMLAVARAPGAGAQVLEADGILRRGA